MRPDRCLMWRYEEVIEAISDIYAFTILNPIGLVCLRINISMLEVRMEILWVYAKCGAKVISIPHLEMSCVWPCPRSSASLIFMFVHRHKLGNESGIYILHMSMFLYRRISNANPRLWHNHRISGRLFCWSVLATSTTTGLYGPHWFGKSNWNPYKQNRERIKYTEAQIWEQLELRALMNLI